MVPNASSLWFIFHALASCSPHFNVSHPTNFDIQSYSNEHIASSSHRNSTPTTIRNGDPRKRTPRHPRDPHHLLFVLSSTSAHPWFWVSISVFLVSALIYKASTPNVHRSMEVLFGKFNSAPPYFLLELSTWLHDWIVKVSRSEARVQGGRGPGPYCFLPVVGPQRGPRLTQMPPGITNLTTAEDTLAAKGSETNAAIVERDEAVAFTDVFAKEKQSLLARIKELESANGTFSNKLQMSEMNVVCLEEQIVAKTESQNEILEDCTSSRTQIAVKIESQDEMLGDMNTLEYELKTTKRELADINMELHNSEMNVISLEQQIAVKAESQNEILDGMDQLGAELKATKAKLQEVAAQKSAIERDLVELRERLAANQVAQTCAREASDKRIIAQKTAEIAQLKEQLAEAIRTESTEPPHASGPTFHPGRPGISVPRAPQLNTPPTSPRISILFGSAKVLFAKKPSISPSSSKFRLSSSQISSRRGSVGDSPKKASSSIRRGRSSASPSKTDKA
ncbi:hypothetical protein LXA43DRAFT_1062498 [Ganoderma leucocontextum]|nr:hypothetical protein LXA43DRAFT_1062498 [Ganoderma leucocontextum]